MLKTTAISPTRPPRAKTRWFPSFILGSQTILNVPRTRNELSWQLGAGGWNPSRLLLLLVCGLVRDHFEQPDNL